MSIKANEITLGSLLWETRQWRENELWGKWIVTEVHHNEYLPNSSENREFNCYNFNDHYTNSRRFGLCDQLKRPANGKWRWNWIKLKSLDGDKNNYIFWSPKDDSIEAVITAKYNSQHTYLCDPEQWTDGHNKALQERNRREALEAATTKDLNEAVAFSEDWKSFQPPMEALNELISRGYEILKMEFANHDNEMIKNNYVAPSTIRRAYAYSDYVDFRMEEGYWTIRGQKAGGYEG